MRIKVLLALIIAATTTTTTNAQNTIGIPNIINYSKQDYHAGSQNWDIKQDGNGVTYFANNDGLLSFDGTFWRLYPLANGTILRSLAIGKNNYIYAGGQGEIGYFSPAIGGELSYTSLTNLIPRSENDFADVWNVIIFQDQVFFCSNKKMFQFADNRITVYNSVNWGLLTRVGDDLIAYDYNKKLVRYERGEWVPIIKTGVFPDRTQVSSVLPLGQDSLLISTHTDGLFILHHDALTRFATPATKEISNKYISRACLIGADKIAFLTNLAGCIILNKKGEFIQRLSKQEGLQHNNILSMFQDRYENIWLGLDNGIDLVNYNNAIKSIFPEQEDRNSGYTSIIFQHRLYLGTSTGVYSARLDSSTDLSYTKSSFQEVKNVTGQIWNLSIVNGKLLMGQNKGAYLIENNEAIPIDETSGFWTFQPLHASSPSSVIIAGTYNGINFYDYKEGKFTNPNIHAHFESARFVAMDSGIIWIAHPYKGLYKVESDRNGRPAASAYQDKRNILSSNHNHIFKIKGDILLTNDKGLFIYDRRERDFIPSAYYRKLFGVLPISYLKEDPYGNIWFCQNRNLGVVDMSGGKARIQYFSEISNKILSGDYENVYIADSNNIFVASEKGFFHINYTQYKKNRYPLQVLVRSVKTLDQKYSLLYGGYPESGAASSSPIIRHKDNSLHFEFSSTLYGQSQNIAYSYYLEGFDKGWIDWTSKPDKDYTNLPAGKYIFKVKCRNSSQNESSVASFAFEVLPPWYQTVWANLIWTFGSLYLLYFFYRRQENRLQRQQIRKLQEQQKKYEEEQKQLQFHHQLAIEKGEKEIVQLKNEKLQTEIEQKNSELASSAMSLVQKGELLSKIKEELSARGKNNGDIGTESKDFKKIIRIIDRELNNTQEWEQFAVHFDDVHSNYLKNIKEKYPALTPTELKLCAYLRLNLSSKEIAQLMNISIRGVETNRYRLRKKLELPNEVGLFDFLLTIK